MIARVGREKLSFMINYVTYAKATYPHPFCRSSRTTYLQDEENNGVIQSNSQGLITRNNRWVEGFVKKNIKILEGNALKCELPVRNIMVSFCRVTCIP